MNDNAAKKNKNGFTVIELMVFIVVGVILLTAVGEIFITTLRSGKRVTAQTDLERSAALGVETIKNTIQPAKTVVASRTFGAGSFTSGNDTLVLEIPSVNSSGNLLAGASDYVVFFRDLTDSSLLKITTEAATGSIRISNTRLVSSFVDSLEFRYNKGNIVDADAIDVNLVTKTTFASETLRASASARVELRNK